MNAVGLDVVRYDVDSLHDQFGARFRLVEVQRNCNRTPIWHHSAISVLLLQSGMSRNHLEDSMTRRLPSHSRQAASPRSVGEARHPSLHLCDFFLMSSKRQLTRSEVNNSSARGLKPTILSISAFRYPQGIRALLQSLRSTSSGLRVLDAGCGSGE